MIQMLLGPPKSTNNIVGPAYDLSSFTNDTLDPNVTMLEGWNLVINRGWFTCLNRSPNHFGGPIQINVSSITLNSSILLE